MDEMKKIEVFLEDREKRVYHQEELLLKLNGVALVTVRVNYPGIDKSNFITDSIGKIIFSEISVYHENDIIFKEEYKNAEGYIGHFVFNIDYKIVKKAMIDLEENHILGRCVDLDVYYLGESKSEGIEKIRGASRCELNLPPRQCFICNEEARICSRAQSHSIEEIKSYFEAKFQLFAVYIKNKNEISSELSQLGLKAMITEVSTIPSFGLVSPTTRGSHKDMDYYTFLESSFAISPYLKTMAQIGYTHHNPKNIFEAIRKIGIKCEEAMFKATKGVNTHKGMIFLLGIVVAATAKNFYEKGNFNNIEAIIKAMSEDILKDFNHINTKETLTHGERLFKEFGFTGIRGEVKQGIPVVFKEVLPKFLKLNLSGNDLYAHSLLLLMVKVEDSTIVHRHSIAKLNQVQDEAQEILNQGGFTTLKGKNAAIRFEERCIEENISPGGSADLLALVIFLGEIYKKF